MSVKETRFKHVQPGVSSSKQVHACHCGGGPASVARSRRRSSVGSSPACSARRHSSLARRSLALGLRVQAATGRVHVAVTCAYLPLLCLPGSYRDAYMALSAPAIFAPFVRLDLLHWEPIYSGQPGPRAVFSNAAPSMHHTSNPVPARLCVSARRSLQPVEQRHCCTGGHVVSIVPGEFLTWGVCLTLLWELVRLTTPCSD